MVTDSQNTWAGRRAPSVLRTPSRAGDAAQGGWFQRRASQLRRSTAPVRRRADVGDLHDVFTAEAPLTVSSPAEAVGEWGADAAARQAGLGDWSPSPSRAGTLDGSTSSAGGSRRASVDGALAAPFTTPQATKLARGHTPSMRSHAADRRASIATTPKSGTYAATTRTLGDADANGAAACGAAPPCALFFAPIGDAMLTRPGPSPVVPSSAAPARSLSDTPPPVLASLGMSLAPIATNATPPRTPLVRTRRPPPPRTDVPDMPAAAPHARPVGDTAPPTGVSERTLKSQSSADTNPDWLFDRVDGSVSSHVSTPSLDVPDGRATPGAPAPCLAALHKHTVRTQSPLVTASPGALPCRDLQQSWAHTPDAEPVLRAMHSEWDLYSYASSDSALSTPVRIRAPPPAAAPLAVRLVQTGAGHLSVVRPEHAHDDEVRAEVCAETTHLSMKACALPLPAYDVLRIPTSLVVLDLSHAALDRLPPALAHCGTLEELNVSHNPLHDLAHWAPLGALHRLRVLLADACALPALPTELAETRELEVLALRSNQLTHLPSWLWVLERLACVLLEGNDAIVPAWQPVLAPLLAPDAAPGTAPAPDAPRAATPTTVVSDAPSPAASDAKRGLLHKALRWGAPRRAERDERAAMRTPSRGSARDADSLRSTTPSDSLRASPKSLVAAMPHAGDATRAPLPPLGPAGAARSSDAGADADVVPCFLPVYAAAPGEAPRAVRRSAYVRDLLHYLADLDDLRPERHVALPVTTAVRLGVPGDSGTPSTPGTPLLPSVASFAAADATPSTTVSPLTPRDASPDTALGVLEADRVKEDASKRQRLINEIVETERTYVANLLELMDIYVKRARQPLDGHPEERVLPVAKERAVFGHIEGIVHFHAHAFLPALEHAAAPALGAPADAPCTAATAARVAHVFTQHAAYFKMYMNYVNQYDSAVRRIARWSQPVPARARSGPKAAIENAGMTLATLGQRLALHSSPDTDSAARHAADDWDALPNARRRQIQAYLAQCRDDPRHSQLNLEGYLLLPIQRIPRYRMLLEQLVRCTAAEQLPRDEADAIPRALAHIALVASWVNEGKRQSEQGRRLLLWQSKLRGNFSAPLVQPHRRLVCDGPLRFRRVARRADAPADAPADTHVLEQTALDQRVQLLLCNDLAAVVATPRDPYTGDAHHDAPTPTPAPAPPIEPADIDAVDLLAVMKPCVRTGGTPGALVPPASVVDEALLRVVDARYVFYFVANSHRDAVQWARAINAQPGG
ncbi:hypothetical protein GLX27_000361 [Malassezia furfur]|uniref:DH domain-containing protein n=1 Tax=Malassezia furfur TaxID=55194 RepID=A0ABY8ELQ3_MALFU|nr:hypothetical protein GLX27_000361 [Malassezia furfur]